MLLTNIFAYVLVALITQTYCTKEMHTFDPMSLSNNEGLTDTYTCNVVILMHNTAQVIGLNSSFL